LHGQADERHRLTLSIFFQANVNIRGAANPPPSTSLITTHPSHATLAMPSGMDK
jgi:hypothetical protein